MSTIWTTPNSIIQYAEHESHIEWDSSDFEMVKTLSSGVSLTKPLLHISRQPKNDILTKTWYIQATDFRFTNIPEVISGVQLRLSVDRAGRVSDDTIQLTCNGELIGENKCTRAINNRHVYGSSTDTWEVSNLADIIQNSTFGVTIRLRSHPSWPHKSTPILRGIELQIY